MDRDELLNDPETAMQTILDGRQAIIWTSMPGIVTSIDYSKMVCSVRPAIQGVVSLSNNQIQFVDLPLLINVPICYPKSNGFALTFPIVNGDEVLIMIASRCIDAWWQNGAFKSGKAAPQQPMELRMHDLSDGFAIPGPCSIPNVIPNISTTDMQLRNRAGTTYISIGANGKIGFENTATSLLETLSDFQNALSVFMTTLAAFSGGAAPVTQAMLQAPAAICETALANVLIEIEALLQ